MPRPLCIVAFGLSCATTTVAPPAPSPPPAASAPAPEPDLSGTNPIPAAPAVEEVKAGFRFIEGPVWLAGPGELLFSDIPASTIYRLRPPADVTVLRTPTANTNGIALLPGGDLLFCEHTGRRLSRARGAEEPRTVADRWGGGPEAPPGRLNSPNDAVVRKDGTIYFTDPDYGVKKEERELPFTGVFRVDPAGKVHLVAADMVRPNGIALSPDETVLYVSNSDPALVRRYKVATDGSTSEGVELARTNGGSDGMAVDDAGNLYTTVDDGIQVFRPDGREWGTIKTPKRPANCTFGDADRKTMYITARESLYRVRVEIAGMP